MDFEIIAITLRRCNQERKKKMSWYRFFRFDGIKTGLQTSDLRCVPDVNLKMLWCGRRRTSPAQWPSSARLTQLTANSEPRIAAADANFAIAFTDRMTTTFYNTTILPCSPIGAQSWRESSSIENPANCGCLATSTDACPQKPAFAAQV